MVRKTAVDWGVTKSFDLEDLQIVLGNHETDHGHASSEIGGWFEPLLIRLSGAFSNGRIAASVRRYRVAYNGLTS